MIQILVNRTTVHIGGLGLNAHAGEYTQNTCGSVTRGNLARTGKDHETAAAALEAARKNGRRLCKNCEKAAERVIAEETAAAEVVEAEIVETVTETAEVVEAPVTVKVVELTDITPGRVYLALGKPGERDMWKIEGAPLMSFTSKQKAQAAAKSWNF